MKHMNKFALGLALPAAMLVAACSESVSETTAEPAGISPQVFTDSLFAVMNSDRANYTNLIVQRL